MQLTRGDTLSSQRLFAPGNLVTIAASALGLQEQIPVCPSRALVKIATMSQSRY